ncbi:AraC family transcriptional regulator [Lacticaseibacillus nasuensis]|nr:AraC family transcriptional regulator [Lacticaseibacillus nasuensis]
MRSSDSTPWQVTDYQLLNLADQQVHLPYALEDQFYRTIQSGDPQLVSKLFAKLAPTQTSHVGTFAKSPLKQSEYSAVIGVVIISRAAIQAGVADSVAYDLSDLYLQQISETATQTNYAQVISAAIEAYCRLIRQAQQAPLQNHYIKVVKAYIYHHLNEKLTLAKLATQAHLNPSYLSEIFHQATGQTLTQFITAERLHAAQYLLQYSTDSVADVASQLGFGTTSYFIATFKRQTHLTPLAYRRHLTE